MNKKRGGIDITFIFIIIAIMMGAVLASGNSPKPPTTPPEGGFTPDFEALDPNRESLQLRDLKFKKVEMPPQGNECLASVFSREDDIIYASDPAFGGVAKAGGQIRIWVWEDDGSGGSVAPGTKVDPTTGLITTPGDRTAQDENGYLWEPSIYITPLSSPNQPGPYSGDKENGGRPNFPVAIKGVANYGIVKRSLDLISAPIDPPVNIITTKTGRDWTFSEFIWDVNALGLTTGYYRAQIILHDGDRDLAINCTTIQI